MFTLGQNNSHSGGFALFSCPEVSGTERSPIANTDANEPFARRIQTSETVDLNQGNGRLNQAKQHQAIQYNWIKPH